MLFSSNVFLFAYLPVVMLLYYISPRKLRNPVLLLWSLVFYGWGEPVYLFLMIGTIVVNYIFGLVIHNRHSRNQNADIKSLVKGLMIESYLEDGAQSCGEHVFGKSITDPCLGWEKTEQLIFDIADKL